VPEHRRGATTGSRHASLRGDRDRISCGSRTWHTWRRGAGSPTSSL